MLNGDIMGISGIMSSALMNPLKTVKNPSQHWKLVYLGTFAINTALLVYGLETNWAHDPRIGNDPNVPIASSLAHLVGGFFVGLGTKLGNGCTTGHGICGLARSSVRSLAAVLSFMGSAMLTRFLTAPWTGWAKSTAFLRSNVGSEMVPLYGSFVSGGLVLLGVWTFFVAVQNPNQRRKKFGACVSAALCATGLAVSRMVISSKVLDFLDVGALFKMGWNGSFDPTLATVMGGGLVTSWLSYQYVDGWSQTRKSEKCVKSPLALEDGSFSVPTNTVIDGELVGGALLFGVGWGIAGLCPGPALFHACAGSTEVLLRWLPMFMVGSYLGQIIKDQKSNNKVKNI